MEETDSESLLERENDYLPRSEIATDQMLAKYRMEEMYHNGKWLLSDDQKDEMLSLYIDMKCFKCNLPDFPNYKDLCEHSMTEHGEIPKVKCCRSLTLQKEGLETHILSEHIRRTTQPVKKDSVHKDDGKKEKVKRNKLIEGDVSTCFTCRKSRDICICKRPTDKKGQCRFCRLVFPTKRILNTHILEEHTGRRVICTICGKSVKKIKIAGHVRSHDPRGFKQCPYCRFVGPNMSEHCNEFHSGDRPLGSSYSPMTFSKKRDIEEHAANEHWRDF